MRKVGRGFTMFEVTVATAIFTVVAGIAFAALIAGNRSLSHGVTRGSVDDRCARLMNAIVGDLRQAGPSDPNLSLAAGSSADDITFTMAPRFSAATRAVDWTTGTRVRWRFRLAATPVYKVAEVTNGRDDNGNGLVDEGYVTRQEGAAGEVTLCTDVLEQSMPKQELDGVDENGNGVIDGWGDWWITNAKVTGTLDLALSTSTYRTILGLYEIQGFRFERGASPRDDQIKVTVTVGGRLEDNTVYARQLVETVLLRSN